MKKILFSLLILFTICLNLEGVVKTPTTLPVSPNPVVEANPQLQGITAQDFLKLTPKQYKEITGKRMTLKQVVQLKVAQKMVKKQLASPASADIPKGLYIVLAILGAGWIALGVLSDWQGKDWWVNLLLTMLCWIPGVIHALMKMKNYYK